jgi:hypothetical protein
MGNLTSKEPTEMASLASQIDDIAVHYILNQNTIDLLRLTDKEYYDNLIILTGAVIDKKLNNMELGFLNNRIFGKKTISDMIDVIPASNKVKDKVIYNISKFYIKIIMIYSAIATTIDPQYSYETQDGNKKTFYLKEMDEYKYIPKNVKPILVQLTNPMNLCRKRLDILKNKLDLNVEGIYIKINPGEKLCSLTTTSKLTDEVGIKELDLLYFDIFDYDTKTWSKRSKKMKQKYNKDLILFYQIFTGKKVKPANIQTFHDIELLNMSTLEQCQDINFMKEILVKKDDVLIQDYIQKINLIESVTQKYRIRLTEILKELFVVKLGETENKYTLNPEMTLDHVILLETETRDTILNLYTSCEKYFIQALIIFENIYNAQVKTLNVERLNYMEHIKTPPPEVIEPTPSPISMDISGTIKPDFGSMALPMMAPPMMNPPTMNPPMMSQPMMNPEFSPQSEPITNPLITGQSTPSSFDTSSFGTSPSTTTSSTTTSPDTSSFSFGQINPLVKQELPSQQLIQGHTLEQGQPLTQGQTLPQGQPLTQGETLPQGQQLTQGQTPISVTPSSVPSTSLLSTSETKPSEVSGMTSDITSTMTQPSETPLSTGQPQQFEMSTTSEVSTMSLPSQSSLTSETQKPLETQQSIPSSFTQSTPTGQTASFTQPQQVGMAPTSDVIKQEEQKKEGEIPPKESNAPKGLLDMVSGIFSSDKKETPPEQKKENPTSNYITSENPTTEQVPTGQVATGQVATGQVATGQVATGQVATGQVPTGQNPVKV